MLGSITAAHCFLSIKRNIENALTTYVLDTRKVRRSNAQLERTSQSGTCIARKVGVPQFPLKHMPVIQETLVLAG